jgi:hypothetical protein
MKLLVSWNSAGDIEIHLGSKPLPVMVYPLDTVRIMLRMTMQNWVDADELRYCVLDFMDNQDLEFTSSNNKMFFPYTQEVDVRRRICK